MRGADLEARKAVKRSFEDQMRQGYRGFERVPPVDVLELGQVEIRGEGA